MLDLSPDWVLAGKATFTVKLPDGDHRTYRVVHKKGNEQWPDAWFAQLLVGPDNEGSYQYIGKLDPDTGYVKLTGASKFKADSYVVRLLRRVLDRIWHNDHSYRQHGYDVVHAGKCCRCGRLLTVPESIETGIGPECAKIMAA